MRQPNISPWSENCFPAQRSKWCSFGSRGGGTGTPHCERRDYEIGNRLAPLREEGILIWCSGNVVHNLHAYAWGRHAPEPYDWAVSFESRVREPLLASHYKPLVNYEHQLGSEAELAVPTPDHYLPLLYVAGTRMSPEAGRILQSVSSA